MLSGFFRNRKKLNNDAKSSFIYYRIVDTGRAEFQFKLQCIKTNAFFNASISEIINDSDILHALHPTQACYLGIEYAKYIEKNQGLNKKRASSGETAYRYGAYTITYQDRNGMVCFCNQTTGEQLFMDPRDIAASEELIECFDASHAFYIGIFAGLKAKRSNSRKPQPHKPNLRLIK